jgi:hypothetical protein
MISVLLDSWVIDQQIVIRLEIAQRFNFGRARHSVRADSLNIPAACRGLPALPMLESLGYCR